MRILRSPVLSFFLISVAVLNGCGKNNKKEDPQKQGSQTSTTTSSFPSLFGATGQDVTLRGAFIVDKNYFLRQVESKFTITNDGEASTAHVGVILTQANRASSGRLLLDTIDLPTMVSKDIRRNFVAALSSPEFPDTIRLTDDLLVTKGAFYIWTEYLKTQGDGGKTDASYAESQEFSEKLSDQDSPQLIMQDERFEFTSVKLTKQPNGNVIVRVAAKTKGITNVTVNALAEYEKVE